MKMTEMTSDDFEIFRELSVNEYASKITMDSGFNSEQCLKDAQADFDKLWTKGLQTENHYCYFLKSDKNQRLGYL